MPTSNAAPVVNGSVQESGVVVQPIFQRLTKDSDRKKFYASLSEPYWWTGGWKKDHEHGWSEIFEQSDWTCIYCSKDLAASTDALAESTIEHLVPRSLLEAVGADPNTAHNLAACCAGCNSLKSESHPAGTEPCWKNRKAYIRACKQFIAKRRYETFKKYKNHVEKVLNRRAGHPG